MRGNVLPEPEHYKSVNGRWSIVRRTFCETFIELQPVAGNAVLCVGDGRHIGPGGIDRGRFLFLRNRGSLRLRLAAESPWLIGCGRTMAIAAIELHSHSVRPHQILFQMHSVIEFNGSGIDAAGTHGRKFGMAGIESVDISCVTRCGAGGAKITVALRATSVAGRSQPQAAAMFSMTRRAVRGKQLVRVVNGAVVAGFAGLVAGFGAENAGLFYVA